MDCSLSLDRRLLSRVTFILFGPSTLNLTQFTHSNHRPLQVTFVKIVFPEATISSSLALLNKQYIQKCYNKQIQNGSLLNSQKYSGIYTNPNPLPFITVCFHIKIPYLMITELSCDHHAKATFQRTYQYFLYNTIIEKKI